jgi:Flp pilus assembly protein TadD
MARPALGSPNGRYQNLESDFHMEEGLLRLQQGRYQAAAQSFQRVLDIDAADVRAKEALAEARKRLRDAASKKKPGAPR